MMKIAKVEVVERSYEPGRTGHGRAWREYNQSTRVYVWPVGETILENLENRRSRPYNEYKPLVLKELKDAGYKVEKIQWDQKAGCKMCPCSPGFIVHLKGASAIRDDGTPVDIHISVKG